MPSIFEEVSNKLFARYECELEFRNKILGGIPKNPKVIEGWLRSRAGISNEEEIRQATLRTLVELGAEITPDMSYDQLVEASDKLAAVKQTNGFKQNGNGLYIEDRQIKAAIKEAVNILYAGDRWGPTKKGPKNFTAERVHIYPQEIPFEREQPDGVEMLIVHANTPQGPRSSLAYHEYLERPKLKFQIKALRDEIKAQHWAEIWSTAEDLGLGACRSQSFGRFEVTKWERIS